MGADLLASAGETASCGTTAINVPDAGWGRQRERPDVPNLCGAAWRADFQSLRAGTSACPKALEQLGRLGPVLAAHGGCARRARAAIAGCSAG